MHTTKFNGEDSVKIWLIIVRFKNLTIVFIIQVLQL